VGRRQATIVKSTSSPGQSYYRSGSDWLDLYDYDDPPWSNTANFCIKALATEREYTSDEFESRGVDLTGWITVDELDPGSFSASDCWGYTSPSGREYAIIGLYRGTGFVDITDPTDPQIVAMVFGDTNAWQDIKVYGHYAYTVTEAENRVIGGIRVFDLKDIDDGIVSHVYTVTSGGITAATRNVAIDAGSGFIYRCGGGAIAYNGLRIYDLANPMQPLFVNSWQGRYVHDAQVVTYTEGLYAGRQIAFCFANDTPYGVNPGVDILDVTDKSLITVLASINLAHEPIFSHPAVFSHQGCLSPDRMYLYVGDEIDETIYPYPPTTTRVIDVSNLSNPVQVSTFTNGGTATDHNIFTHDDLIFEANYRSGLRIFDARDPVSPVEIAYFDTYPPDDAPRLNGLWGVYPYFASGTIIGSDMEKGLFVWQFRDCRVAVGSSTDCNRNGLSDDCDIDDGISGDCNANQVPDECDIADGTLTDDNGNGIPDGCEYCSDADCDDALYCNGAETCDDGTCVQGEPPCPHGVCNEETDECLSGPCCFVFGSRSGTATGEQAIAEMIFLGYELSGDGNPGDGVCFDWVPREDCIVIGGGFLGYGLSCDGDPDGDGAYGCDDGCPLDSDKVEPGICGCGTSDDDTDGDGIADCMDWCPEEPGPYDTNGCPVIGACCFRVGVCIDNADPEDCASVGGVYQGYLSSCEDGCIFPGDVDGDADVDLADVDLFVQCMTGPDGTTTSGCEAADTDHDDNVDLGDFAELQVVFTG
jgi:choice-of-anchor B domain-containing protein